MAKARIEYEEDETSRLYRIKRWYAHNHWDVKKAMKRITLLMMFVPAGYLIGIGAILLIYISPILIGAVIAAIMALVAFAIWMND